ncbi:hypothetical protein EDS67_22780 [candidate division KSB1 bacterium]|nr:MAG: hypothetical protein EDS67_22780 [candidate division KSB1 bacterium]MBC6950040.1 hypothetical protein [candidate division KSB1 bacterium]MCE7945115.1 hypothetical protein [Chlorobi bacterium CHB1]
MELFNAIGSFVSILAALFSLLAWLKARRVQKDLQNEKARQSKKITVTLQYGGQKIELPVELRRAELTRAEILGRLGMIPMKKTGARFSLSYLNKLEFQKQLNQIMDGNGDAVLTIPCTQEEFEQFDLTK